MSTQKNAVPLQIKKERTLRQILRDSFHYMGGDALLLCKAAGIYSFSLLLASLLLAHFALGAYPSLDNLYYFRDNVSQAGYTFMIVCVVAYTGSFCMLTLLINKLLLLREERTEASADQLFAALKTALPMQLGNYTFNFLIVYLLYYFLDYFLDHSYLQNFIGEEKSIGLTPFDGELDWLLVYLPQLIIMPLVLYFGFSSLFMSVRDSIGSSDAFKNIYALSKNRLKTIWLYSFALLLLILIGRWALDYRSEFLFNLLPVNYNLLTVVFTFKKLLSFSLLAFVQVGIVLLFGSVEAESEKPVVVLNQAGGE